jgi:hypothetical protein
MSAKRRGPRCPQTADKPPRAAQKKRGGHY